MKKLLLLSCLCLHSVVVFSQTNTLGKLTDSLQYITGDSIGCESDISWRIVAQGEPAIPYLIDKLTDTTLTPVKHHCKSTPLNVGELAYFALIEIADFPAFAVTHIQFDVFTIDESTGKYCWTFYDFLFLNRNKALYQKNMRDWYAREKKQYKKIVIPSGKRTGCQKKYGIASYYRWRNKEGL